MVKYFLWKKKWWSFNPNKTLKIDLFPMTTQQGGCETPAKIFTNNPWRPRHQGGEWLSKTSKSYSLVAAFVATIAFTASNTVPDGVKGSGTPILESHQAFDIFAASLLVALGFSVTSLFLFLSILTSRYQQNDFRSDLPKKLLFGLTSLFISLASMLISFCGGHFFVLKDKLKNNALPVYATMWIDLSVGCFYSTFYNLIWACLNVFTFSIGWVSRFDSTLNSTVCFGCILWDKI